MSIVIFKNLKEYCRNNDEHQIQLKMGIKSKYFLYLELQNYVNVINNP